MKLLIDFQRPPNATSDDIAEFVLAALTSWGGGLHPEDPMFHSLRGRINKITVHGKTYGVEPGNDRKADQLLDFAP
jgi:hypothetical protein